MERDFMIEPISRPPETFSPQRTQKRVKRTEEKEASSDTVVISEEGKRAFEIAHEIEIAKKVIQNTPDIREEKVKEAQRRLREGFYNRAEVLEAIAERLIEELSA